MKKRVVLNVVIYGLIYGLLLIFSLDPTPSYQRGGVRGLAIAIPLLLLAFLIATAYVTRKAGGDWAKVRKNIRHNFLGLIIFGKKRR